MNARCVMSTIRGPVREAEVAEQRFTPVVLKTGYRMDDVDDYLTEAEHLLREREIVG